jgi:hypothetical protein
MWLFGCESGVALLVQLLIATGFVVLAIGWAVEGCCVVWMSVFTLSIGPFLECDRCTHWGSYGRCAKCLWLFENCTVVCRDLLRLRLGSCADVILCFGC